MTDQEFQDMLLTALAEMKAQRTEDNERLEKRLDAIETQREKDSGRLEKRLDTIEAQRTEDNERLEKRLDTTNKRLEKRFDAIEIHVGQLKHDVGWIKGKLEGKQEGSGRILTVFTTGAVIIALIALFS